MCLEIESLPNPLPVGVFIPGGAFQAGGGSEDYYLAQRLAEEEVVIVTINYRLGFLGYGIFNPKYVKGQSLNNGLADQRVALQWVQKNIAQFGGDPRRVTIFGESAGAHSVLIHLADPRSQGLFDGAIMESIPAKIPLGKPNKVYVDADLGFAPKAGCGSTSAVTAYNCIKNKATVEAILKGQAASHPASQAFNILSLIYRFAPVLDGEYLIDQPVDALASSWPVEKRIPIIAGTNRDEANMFVNMFVKKPVTSKYEAEGWFFALYHRTLTTQSTYYDASAHDGDYRYSIALSMTDYIFNCALNHMFDQVRAVDETYPLYRYYYETTNKCSLAQQKMCQGNVCHADELPEVFGTWDKLEACNGVEIDPVPGINFRKAWSDFVKWPYADPGGIVPYESNKFQDIKSLEM